MDCVACGSTAVTERSERTIQGYRRFRCRTCSKQFNERSGTVLNLAEARAVICAPRPLTNGTASIAEVDSTRARLIRRCDPNRAVGDRILVHVERLKHGHSLIALLAVPERPHIVSTVPLRDQIPRIGIILVPK